ncbi:hypothetical protein J4211_00785 [Candidatus Woesearchaeota archaeon]|nr:hypothetical protein [Candidatus Woesearchaeota archaeon]
MRRAIFAKELTGLFRELDKRLITKYYNYSRPIEKFDIVAMGGTALEMAGLKQVSKDIDLYLELSSVGKTAPDKDPVNIADTLTRFIKEHFDGSQEIAADVAYDGIGSWNLIGFNIHKYKLPEKFSCFNLYILDLVDLCITKLVRYSPEDTQDIEKAIKACQPTVHELESRLEAYLKRLKNAGNTTIVITNFNRLKTLYTQWDIKPVKWYEFWRQ